ncbi:MAG: bifunctional DNA primase/polymerase [Pseudomonadota bacterium]
MKHPQNATERLYKRMHFSNPNATLSVAESKLINAFIEPNTPNYLRIKIASTPPTGFIDPRNADLFKMALSEYKAGRLLKYESLRDKLNAKILSKKQLNFFTSNCDLKFKNYDGTLEAQVNEAIAVIKKSSTPPGGYCMQTLKTTLEYAKKYLSQGFSIIPILPHDKKPALPWKEYQARKPAEEEIKAWFKTPNYNLGIVTGKISGLSVVDLDKPEVLQHDSRITFPRTPCVKTARGAHLYFRYAEGVRNFQNRPDLPGLDLRGEGGYVVAPPSIHPNGSQYHWDKKANLETLAIAPFPEGLIPVQEIKVKQLPQLYKGAPEGNRNEALTKICGSLAWDGLGVDECLQLALAWNTLNQPPLPEQEIERTVKSICDRHSRRTGSAYKQGQQKRLILTSLEDLLQEPVEQIDYLVDRLLPLAGFSIMGSKPKVGKSTLARNLALCVSRGAPFLDKATKQGKVIYLELEEKRSEVKKHFQDMGADGSEPIYIYASSAPMDALEQLQELTIEIRLIV